MCSELKKKQGVRAGGSDRTLDSSIAREDLRSKPVPVWKGRLEISVVVGPTATRPGTLWNLAHSGTPYFTFMVELVLYSQSPTTLNPPKMSCFNWSS